MINQTLKRQHYDIRRALQELQEDVYDIEEVLKNQLTIALRIGNLSGILLMHLKYEDEYLYPELLKHASSEVKALAESNMQEMGTLAKVFEEYQDKYLRKPGSIMKETASFIEDTNRILYTISKRVESEEHELFPLLHQQ